jgi:hypothetical protein
MQQVLIACAALASFLEWHFVANIFTGFSLTRIVVSGNPSGRTCAGRINGHGASLTARLLPACPKHFSGESPYDFTQTSIKSPR